MSENKSESQFATLFKSVEYIRVSAQRDLDEQAKMGSNFFSHSCQSIVLRYRTANTLLQKALDGNQINPSQVVLLQESLAEDLAQKSLQVIQKLEAIYSKFITIGALFGGASKMAALDGALVFMQEVGNLTYQYDNAFRKRLIALLKGRDPIRDLMRYVKILDPSNDFPYEAIVAPFLPQ